MRIVFGGINSWELSLTEDITIYAAGDVGKFGDARI